MIPHEYIEELVQRSDIVDVVQSYVQLRHRGRTHRAVPVSQRKNTVFLWCIRDAVVLLLRMRRGRRCDHVHQKINNVDYVEAVKTLASGRNAPAGRG